MLIAIFEVLIETSGEPGITFKFWMSTKLSGRIISLTWILVATRGYFILYLLVQDSRVSVPIRIEISIHGIFTPVLFDMLVAQAHRWRQAALSFEFVDLINTMFSFKPSSTHFPLLEDLSFRCYNNFSKYFGQNPILQCRPPLQKLELDILLESYADLIASQNLKVLKPGKYIGVSPNYSIYVLAWRC
ncbi:hypothetical protein BDP27DRAFT_1429508 [Rhodocollybia butyracea]|uniref:Uncharacterized protein n=1 Tax=Rhodocollybia butyracea TaxID=206335 RepID=A0A9P5PBQ3_9AGAR|nr:hypothetical protein BDP27DRAFT_1429508 [Rhodocollybia butyracea]